MQENNDKKKRPPSKIGVGLVFGIGIGVAIGAGTDNIAIGIAVGVAIGIAIGAAWDQQARRNEDPQDDN
jgi:hypothetical protein